MMVLSLTHLGSAISFGKAFFDHPEMKRFVLVMDFLIAWTQLEGKRPGNRFAQNACGSQERENLSISTVFVLHENII